MSNIYGRQRKLLSRMVGTLFLILLASTLPTVTSETPTASPTKAPVQPTASPNANPSANPSASPTKAPVQLTVSPTAPPTKQPTASPTEQPSMAPIPPTISPTTSPTTSPTEQPSMAPIPPTTSPTSSSTTSPSNQPSKSPIPPTTSPTTSPTAIPSNQPSKSPIPPTTSPTTSPTAIPSDQPSKSPIPPTTSPTTSPTAIPSDQPSKSPIPPTTSPTTSPTAIPSNQPSKSPIPPTTSPTVSPIGPPTEQPSKAPAQSSPTTSPEQPSNNSPTQSMSPSHSMVPSIRPSSVPSAMPSMALSMEPSNPPSGDPSVSPTAVPTTYDDCRNKYDTTDKFTVGTQTRSCAWVRRFSTTSRCRLENVSENCPFTCGFCSYPTQAPSTPAPTQAPITPPPTQAPSIYNCTGKEDTIGRFDVPGINSRKKCSWAGNDIESRCIMDNVLDNCPFTCGRCSTSEFPTYSPTISTNPTKAPTRMNTTPPTTYDCNGKVDRSDRFFVASIGTQKDCEWVRTNAEGRCGLSSLTDYCPITCGLCPEFPSQPPSIGPTTSAKPSSSPSLTPPLEVTSTIKIELGPISGNEMNTGETLFFEETVKAWIEPMLSENDPKITLTKFKVTNQTVVSARRRLADGGAMLTVEGKMKGEFNATDSFTESTDVGFGSKVENQFTDGEKNTVLINNLKSSDDPDGDYFDSVTALGFSRGSNPSGINTGPRDSTSSTSNSSALIAGLSSGGAVLLFAIALYAYARKRKR